MSSTAYIGRSGACAAIAVMARCTAATADTNQALTERNAATQTDCEDARQSAQSAPYSVSPLYADALLALIALLQQAAQRIDDAPA
jgi:hypothetical protein